MSARPAQPAGGSTLSPPSVAPPPAGLTLTSRREEEDEPDQRPLEFGLIKRLIGYTARFKAKRNWLLFLTVLRSIQLPLVTWSLTEVITGPIAARDIAGVHYGVLAYAALAILTDVCFHFRQRLALELGETVVLHLRREVFSHLQRMPMSFYNRTKLGRIISRLTSDIETVRVGVQDVLFVSIVQIGQMLVTAGFMLWLDWVLFSVIAAMAPILWMLNRHFRRRLSSSLRNVQESFSRVTSTIAESVSGMRVTQGFVRGELNAGIFRQLAATHSRNNMTVARNSALLTPLLELNSQFFIAVLILLGGWRVLHPGSGAEIGDLVKFFFLANLFFAPVLSLGNQYNNALTAMAGAERVFRLLDLKPEWE
ncbi:MAG: ABC transporter ATP-binding protein, partial [Opitutaceae bacterium]